MYQIYIGLFTEGNTDIRFLESLVERVFLKIALECCHDDIEIEILPVTITKKGKDFSTQVVEVLIVGYENQGINMLCVHADADNKTLKNTYENKINKAISAVENNTELKCNILIPLIPIQETEAWMLADKELLKLQIGTTKSDRELGIDREPENIANPKEVIENAISVVRSDLSKRRRHELNISDLYSLIGQSLDISKLETLASYQDFRANIISAFKKYGIIRG
jgi:hypothetical protein